MTRQTYQITSLTTLLISLLALSSTCLWTGRTYAFAPQYDVARPVKSAATTSHLWNAELRLQRHPPVTKRTETSLKMASPAIGLGVIAGAISGGLFSGGLHAIAGPDHLAALLPRCCGQRWYKAVQVGALWGMGHGVSATLLGLFAFGLKSTVHSLTGTRAVALRQVLARASHVTELAVGLSLVLIGIMGMREARAWKEDLLVHGQSLSAAATDVSTVKQSAQKRAVIFNGLLHGFSWDGAPSLAPAVAVATWGGSLAFLLSYAVGTMTTMAIATTLIGEGTRKAGQFFDRPDLPQKLSFVSSILAIAIGVVWCGLALA